MKELHGITKNDISDNIVELILISSEASYDISNSMDIIRSREVVTDRCFTTVDNAKKAIDSLCDMFNHYPEPK